MAHPRDSKVWFSTFSLSWRKFRSKESSWIMIKTAHSVNLHLKMTRTKMRYCSVPNLLVKVIWWNSYLESKTSWVVAPLLKWWKSMILIKRLETKLKTSFSERAFLHRSEEIFLKQIHNRCNQYQLINRIEWKAYFKAYK